MPARKESRSRAADAGRAELAGVALRELDALRRVRVAGQEVEAGVGRAADLRGSRCRPTSTAGSAPPQTDRSRRWPMVLMPMRVGLQLLVARELRQPSLPRISAALALGHFAEHVGHDLGGEHLLGLLLLALQAVIGGDVAHLVGDDGGELGRIVGQRQQPARHVEIAAGQREGVDVGRVEDGDAVGLRRDCRTPCVRLPTTLATMRSSFGSEYSPP